MPLREPRRVPDIWTWLDGSTISRGRYFIIIAGTQIWMTKLVPIYISRKGVDLHILNQKDMKLLSHVCRMQT